jgi:hypothetical protein
MSQYVHPEFGFFCPSPRLRRWLRLTLAAVAVGGIGLGVMATGHDTDADSAAAVAAADARAAAETSLPVSFTPVAAVAPRSSAAAGAQIAADKPSCLGDSASVDGKCAVEKPRKPRMVRVPGNRPVIASIPLGRTAAPHLGANEISTPAAGAASGRQADTSKTAQATTADAATAGSTEQAQKPAATKKKTAHNRRRDQYGYGGWREVRVDDGWSRGYGYGYGYGYSRGGYGRSFW